MLCTKRLTAVFGDIVSIEGRAIRQEFQGQGLGSLALRHLLKQDNSIVAAASVTRNPAVPKVMSKCFAKVAPDLSAIQPLEIYNDPQIKTIMEAYGNYLGISPQNLPFAVGRYKGGLYGYEDVGKQMDKIPQIANYPENGIIMAAINRRES